MAERIKTAGTDNGSKAVSHLELMLAGQAKALEAVFGSELLASLTQGRARSRQMENVYYDTPQLDLRRQGVAFRVRKDGRKFEQTLTSDGTGSRFDDLECQTPLASAQPMFDALPEGFAGDGSTAAIRPLFTTRYRRKTRRLETRNGNGAAAVIEAAFDLGEIEANGESLPIAELKLELIDGPPVQLYELALALEQQAPLRLESRSKAARGYGLATGVAPDWQKAGDLALDSAPTVGEAMASIFGDCFHHWRANEAAAAEGSDPEGVHQMRVALRRLRSALAVFRDALPKEQRNELKDAAKALIGALGPARDWDVFLTETLPAVRTVRPEDVALDVVQAAAERQKGAGYQVVQSALAAPEHTDVILRFGRWLEGWGWQEGADDEQRKMQACSIVDFADQQLKKRLKKALHLGDRFADLTPPERHQLRIALKKLRYTAEFFTSLYKAKRTKAFLRRLKTLQDDLGSLNDVTVAERLIAEAFDKEKSDAANLQRGSGLILGWHAGRVRAIEPELLDRWSRFADSKPFWH